MESAHAWQRALQAGQKIVVTVASDSMAPTLRAGQTVVVRPGRATIGDVVLIRGANLPTLHRLVARISLLGYARFVHAGDAPGAVPGRCRVGDVLGVAEVAPRVPAPIAQLVACARAIVRL